MRVSAPALSDLQTKGQRVEAWKQSIPLGALTQGELCQGNAVVKPWIGEAWDLGEEGVAWPTGCPQTRLRFLCDKAGSYGGAIAFVKAGASGGAAALDEATARASPFPTINAAFAALPAFNLANRGHNDHSGATVYLMDDGAGGAAAHAISAAFGGVAAGKCHSTITVDPLATGAVSLSHVTANRTVPSMLRWHRVPITAAFGLDGGSTANDSVQVYDDLTVTVAGNSAPFNYRNGLCWLRNVTLSGVSGTGGNPFKALSNTRMRLHAIGVVCTDATANMQCYPYAMIGCDLRRASIVEYDLGAITNAEAQDGAVIANNRLLNQQSASALGNFQSYARGLALVQNVFERAVVADSVQCLSISEAALGAANVLVAYNSFPGVDTGARFNWLYTDDAGAAGVSKQGVARFNLFHEYNVKTDTFVSGSTASGRVGNWRVRYGVGAVGNVVAHGTSESGNPGAADAGGGNWLGEFVEPGSVGKAGAVAFADNRSGTTGAGGGDYRLMGVASAAYGRVPAGMAGLGFDLDGAPRLSDGAGAAGAYERAG